MRACVCVCVCVCMCVTGVPLRYPPLHGAPHPGLEASHALHGQAQADLLPLPEGIPDDVNVVKKIKMSVSISDGKSYVLAGV